MIPKEKSKMKAKKKVMVVTFFVLFIVNYVKNNPNLHCKLPLFFLFHCTFFLSCPGAVLFLFKFPNGQTILHTGEIMIHEYIVVFQISPPSDPSKHLILANCPSKFVMKK